MDDNPDEPGDSPLLRPRRPESEISLSNFFYVRFGTNGP